MAEFFSSVLDFIKLISDYIGSFFGYLGSFFSFLGSCVTYLFGVIGQLPVFLVAPVTCAVSVYIIRLILDKE